MDFTSESSDFHDIVIRDEDGYVHVGNNSNNAGNVPRWKDIFCAKNKVCFNVHCIYDVQRLAFHKKFICFHGDKCHAGVKKTNTG